MEETGLIRMGEKRAVREDPTPGGECSLIRIPNFHHWGLEKCSGLHLSCRGCMPRQSPPAGPQSGAGGAFDAAWEKPPGASPLTVDVGLTSCLADDGIGACAFLSHHCSARPINVVGPREFHLPIHQNPKWLAGCKQNPPRLGCLPSPGLISSP
jgi:hypothetical protein